MLWFRKSKKDADRSTSRRGRRSSRSSRSSARRRGRAADRRARFERSESRRPRRSPSADRRETPREDTRDRDERRKAASRDRTVAKEREEVFEAINFDGEAVAPDEVDRGLGRVLYAGLYALIALLLAVLVVHAVGWGIGHRQAARIVPLQAAAVEGELDVLRSLLAEGVPVDGIGPEGGTALISAIRAGRLDSAQFLLESGAAPSEHAMRVAMRYEHWDILEALVRAGGDPEVRDSWTGRSPLELAVERRDIEMIEFLLAHGADPAVVSHEGPSAQPALHHAAGQGMEEVVELLLEHGAHPGRMWMGYLPRHLAEDAGHAAVADRLARAEAAMRGEQSAQ